MGFSLKSIGHALGNVAKAANPVSHALYSLVGGKSVGDVAKGYATDAGRAALGGAALGAGYLAAPAVGSALGIGGAGAGAAGAAGAAGGGGMTAGLAGGLGGLTSLGGIAKGILGVAPLAIGAYGAYENAQQAKQGQALQDEALAYARARDAELAPLRTAGIGAVQQAMGHPVTPFDAVGGYVDAGNPYMHTPRGAPAPAIPAAPPAPTMPVQIGGLTPLTRGRTARRSAA